MPESQMCMLGGIAITLIACIFPSIGHRKIGAVLATIGSFVTLGAYITVYLS